MNVESRINWGLRKFQGITDSLKADKNSSNDRAPKELSKRARNYWADNDLLLSDQYLCLIPSSAELNYHGQILVASFLRRELTVRDINADKNPWYTVKAREDDRAALKRSEDKVVEGKVTFLFGKEAEAKESEIRTLAEKIAKKLLELKGEPSPGSNPLRLQMLSPTCRELAQILSTSPEPRIYRAP